MRRRLHRLLFLHALELGGHRIEEAAVLDELVAATLDGPAAGAVLARLRNPSGPWPTGPLTPSGLGALHELYLATASDDSCGPGTSTRKRLGAYYTPQAIVDYMVGRACDRLVGPPTPMPRGQVGCWTLLDPTCGGGRFLIAAFAWLVNWYREAWEIDELTATERLRIVRHHLHGSELDPLAVDIARLALALALSQNNAEPPVHPCELEQNVIVGDALRLVPAEQGQLALATEEVATEEVSREPRSPSEQSFPGPLGRGGFDLVIGNPPYASFSGRQARRRTHCAVDSERVVPSRGSWPALHSLFVEHAIERLSRQLVAFVVPDQLGHLASYEPLRQIVTRNAGLVDVRYWGENMFPDVVSPILTFLADRRYGGQAAIESREGHVIRKQIAGGARWHAVRSERLVTRLLEENGSLGHLVGDPGVHTGNCAAKLIVAAVQRPPEAAVPVLEGRLVDRYRCAPPTKSLRLDYKPTQGEYFRIGREERYSAASFLIRQTAAFPIVGPRRGGLYFRNSLLSLFEPENADVRFVVGLLNSSLMRALYRLMVPEAGQRAFPQVKVASLRMLPIKWPSSDCAEDRGYHDRVVGLVDRLLELGATQGACTKAEWQACDAELDALVFDFYRVTAAERRELIGVDPLAAQAMDRVAA